MFERILVPVDGSRPATAALEHASEMATAVTASLHLLHVVDSNANGDADLSSTGEDVFSDALDRIPDSIVSITEEVRQGDTAETILAYAREHDVDVVVMGTHGRKGIGRFLLGSVTERVVRDADVPVLTVRADDVRTVYPYETILVPTDGSVHAIAALDIGIELASETGATIHLLSVVDVPTYGVDFDAVVLVDQLEATAREALEREESRAIEAGVDVETAVTYGRVHTEIRDHAEDEDVDVIVMGTHGRSGFDRFLLGSVTERVLRTAPSPVLAVRGREPGEE